MKWGNNTATHILLAHSCFRPHARLCSFCDQCDSHVPVAHCAWFARNFWWVPNGKQWQGISKAESASNQSKISAQARSRAVVHSHGDDGNPRRCGQSSSRWACCERTGEMEQEQEGQDHGAKEELGGMVHQGRTLDSRWRKKVSKLRHESASCGQCAM